jgi:hypothetical protein
MVFTSVLRFCVVGCCVVGAAGAAVLLLVVLPVVRVVPEAA